MKEINMNAFDNVIQGTYDECQKAFDKAVGEFVPRQWKTYGGHTINEWARFSMFDTVEHENDGETEDWVVKYPDFESNPLICEGDLKIRINDWDGAEITLTNPRINDVFRFFANNHDGHHGFIEGVDLVNGILEITSGS